MEHATVAVLPEGPKTEWGLRREPKENGLATYEAIARAIGIIEGKEIQHNMEELFRVMVHTTMKIQGSFVNRSGLS
jgi:DTW domain-containing protein YfiP